MSMRDALDISSYLVIGLENTCGRPVGDVVSAALAAGFTCVQVRSKVCSARELMACADEAARAIERKTGARGLRNVMERTMLDIMFRLPSMPGVKECLINRAVIEKGKEPVLLYDESAEGAAADTSLN